jgi:hypothetical protein
MFDMCFADIMSPNTSFLRNLLYLVAYFVCGVHSISFMLEPGQQKCLKDEVHKDILVTGDFKLSESIGGIKTDLTVLDTKGHMFYSKEDALEGKFAFTTDDYDQYEVCFKSTSPAGDLKGKIAAREVTIVLKHGVEAKNYDETGKAEKLKPLEQELRKLEDLSEAIVNDFSYMKQREEHMRDTNESTNTRVLYFSIFSMCCLFGLATWQVIYLRRYFKSKKLIE